MLDSEFQILSNLKNKEKYHPDIQSAEEKARFISLKKKNWIRIELNSGFWELTPFGLAALLEAEEIAQVMADEERKKRAEEDKQNAIRAENDRIQQRKSFRHDFILCLVSIAGALFVDHFADILEFANDTFGLFFAWIFEQFRFTP